MRNKSNGGAPIYSLTSSQCMYRAFVHDWEFDITIEMDILIDSNKTLDKLAFASSMFSLSHAYRVYGS